MPRGKKTFSIYVHIPFCVSKCGYCDFLSFAGRDGCYGRYTDALVKEIESKAAGFAGRRAETVFFGGGTPTVLPVSALRRVLTAISDNFDIHSGTEITTEANPDTVSFEKLADLRASGFNRISLGVQSWNDAELRALGRAHGAARAMEAFNAARRAGFRNINIDLMFALPGQSAEDWEETLRVTAGANPEHVSCYSLTIEENTPFGQNGVKPANDETDRAMYRRAAAFLAENGYKRYEISNFSKPGFECRHNKTYWERGEYLGIGLGAHSFAGGERFRNAEDIAGYTGGDFSAYEKARLSRAEEMAEFMILGLRMENGVSPARFAELFGEDVRGVYGSAVSKSMNAGLMRRRGGRLALTPLGIDLSNRVFVEFLA
jgi:oxygen-independent coproporphyrinogen-3 oxidase